MAFLLTAVGLLIGLLKISATRRLDKQVFSSEKYAKFCVNPVRLRAADGTTILKIDCMTEQAGE
jgi:hypothetical protein